MSNRREAVGLALARAGRWLRDVGVPIAPRARLVYHPDYVDFPRERGARHAFDVLRPRRIVQELRAAAVISRDQLLEPEPLTRAELLTTHSPRFLDEIASPRQLAELLNVPDAHRLGAENDEPLRPFLLQAGGTLLAARAALRDRRAVFNLGGGFHHAQRDRAAGFCPINDVAVAINVLREQRAVRRVLVVDFDYHHGDGTAAIFADDDDVFTLSVHGQSWAELGPRAANLDVELPSGTRDAAYLTSVRDALERALREISPQLVFYLAGADALRGDQLGDFAVSEQALLGRDLHVYRTFAGQRVPLAVVLAGGYGPMSWAVPFNFIYSVLTGGPIAERLRPSNIAARLQRRRMATSELAAIDERPFDEGAIFAELDSRGQGVADGRFCGFYTREAVVEALERYELSEMLRERGFDPLVAIDTSEDYRHLMRIYDGSEHVDRMLVELAARVGTVDLPSEQGADVTPQRPALVIEWLMMQDPYASFSLERPQLPGQERPGLGIARWVLELLRLMAGRLQCEALSNSPQSYHNAAMYGAFMRFVDPYVEGRFRALEQAFGDAALVDAAWAVERGEVRTADGEPYRWQGGTQVMALSRRTRAYFDSDTYVTTVAATRGATRYDMPELLAAETEQPG